MIKPDLKVGDTFTDGNRTYKVVAVVSKGLYISKVVTGDEKIEAQKVETTEEKTYTKTEINRMSTEALKELAQTMDIEAGTGTEMKKAIIKKLGL